MLHQRPSDSALKSGKREVPGSIPGRACRPSCLEFSVVFSETHKNTCQDSLERPPTEGITPIGPGPTSGQLALTPVTAT